MLILCNVLTDHQQLPSSNQLVVPVMQEETASLSMLTPDPVLTVNFPILILNLIIPKM